MIIDKTDDCIKIKDDNIASKNYNRTYTFDFGFIKCKDNKTVVKKYFLTEFENNDVRIVSLHRYFDLLRVVYDFFENKEIKLFKDMVNVDVDELVTYINLLKNKKCQPYSIRSKRDMLMIIKHIFSWGRIHMPWYVPQKEIFVGNEFPAPARQEIKYIPDSIVQQINSALLNENNPYIKYGIIVMEATGLRRSELLRLKTNCVQKHPISGYYLEWFDYKKQKKHRLPINNICVEAINRLIKETAKLRDEANDDVKDYVFIRKRGRLKDDEIIRLPDASFTTMLNGSVVHGKMKRSGFVQRHNIVDADGNYYPISARQFRRTLASDMFSKGVNIKVIQEVLGHSNPQTTKVYYAEEKDTERIKTFNSIGIIGDIGNISQKQIKDKDDLIWFKENFKTKARLCDGYCTKPLKDGKVCDRLIKRYSCYSCKRYITTPEYLQFHKEHLAELEEEIALNIYGEHYANHIKPIIEILKEIINRLEALQ